jgi:HD superfamily phosphodiesterase
MTSGRETLPGPIHRRTHMTDNSTENIPTEKECHELMVRHSMLPNIVEHSLQVMRVSLAITDNLKEDVCVNRDLVIAGSLLHDITKTRSL